MRARATVRSIPMCRSRSTARATTICPARSETAAASSNWRRRTGTSPLRENDGYHRRRNCDGSVQRSALLETLDQILRLLPRDAADLETQPHLIEDREIRPHRGIAIEQPF